MRMRGKKAIFSRRDVWSLDCTLSSIIVEGLRKFKEVISEVDSVAGCPSSLVEDGEDVEDGIKKWHEILDKMIYAFTNDEPETPENLFSMETFPAEGSGLIEFKLHVNNQRVYDEYKAKEKEHERRVTEGLELFSKYYQSLWY